jgi:anti-sigma B factor antagonist
MQMVTRELDGGGLLIAFAGETALDASTTDALRAALSELGDQYDRIVVDFGNVSFLDSSALGAFVSLLRRVTQKGGSLRIAALRPGVKMIFEVTRLDRVFVSAETVEEALAAVAAA